MAVWKLLILCSLLRYHSNKIAALLCANCLIIEGIVEENPRHRACALRNIVYSKR